MTQIAIAESGYRQGTRAVVPEGDGQKFKVRIMGWEPGSTVVEGSSADYPIDRIVRDFPAAFPKGTRMRANHDGICEAGGDVRRVWAKTTSAPWEEADGMYAEAITLKQEAADFVLAAADVVGTSITASADIEMVAKLNSNGDPILDENDEPVMVPKKSERGAQIVERFLPMTESPYNSIDFVEAPGADGAIVSLLVENAKRLFENTSLREAVLLTSDLAGKREKTSAANRPGTPQQEEVHMDPKVIEAAVRAVLDEALTPINTFLADEGARRQAEADAQAGAGDVTEAVKAAVATVEAVKAAKLPVKVEAQMIEAVENGEDITERLELAKEVIAEAGSAPRESADSYIVHESDSSKSDDFALTFGGRR